MYDDACDLLWQVDDTWFHQGDTGLTSLSAHACPERDVSYWVRFSMYCSGFDDPQPQNWDARWQWPELDWPYDDPSCSWFYLTVAYKAGRDCARPDEARGGTAFVVSGVMPYAVYEVLREDPTDDGMGVAYKIRYWVGLINHFSFLLADVDGEADKPYLVDDLPDEVFDPIGDGSVLGSGTLTAWYMSLISSTASAAAWTDSTTGGTISRGVEYFCQADINGQDSVYDTYDYTPDVSGSDPTDQAFSDHDAYDDSDSKMTSLLGFSMSGTVCITIPNSEARRTSTATLAKEGFVALFGDLVRLEHRIKFYGPDGTNLAGYDEFEMYEDWAGAPHEVAKWFCLRKRDLETVDAVVDRVAALRSSQTPHSRWVFREFDATRLAAARDAAVASAQACECLS